MQKLKLTPVANAKKLNRNELKNIFGGDVYGSNNQGSGKYNGWKCCSRGGGCTDCKKGGVPSCSPGKQPESCFVYKISFM